MGEPTQQRSFRKCHIENGFGSDANTKYSAVWKLNNVSKLDRVAVSTYLCR